MNCCVFVIVSASNLYRCDFVMFFIRRATHRLNTSSPHRRRLCAGGTLRTDAILVFDVDGPGVHPKGNTWFLWVSQGRGCQKTLAMFTALVATHRVDRCCRAQIHKFISWWLWSMMGHTVGAHPPWPFILRDWKERFCFSRF